MTGLSFKSAVFSLLIVCFLSGSALADTTFTFTGMNNAFLNAESMDFILSGPSFFIHSGFEGGPNVLALCTTGTVCTIPSQDIPTNPVPGDSGGTVGGVTADILEGELTFSSFSFTAEPNVNGTGSVTVTGNITGYDFLPGTMDVGPQVFDLQISGSGTGTASAIAAGGPLPIFSVEYSISGTATAVPEPSSLLLLSISLLVGFAAIRRWHLIPRVND